jgi:hypothetical protein
MASKPAPRNLAIADLPLSATPEWSFLVQS